MYTAVIFAALAVAVLGHPPTTAPPIMDPDMPLFTCTYHTKTEMCRWKHMKKYDSEYEFAKETHQKQWMMMEKPEECDDGDRWDISCPCDAHAFYDGECQDINGEAISEASPLENCRKSCKECGEDAFLTVLKEYEEEEKDSCCEYSKYYPYKCTKMEKEQVLVPAMLVTPVDFMNCANADTAPVHLCITFRFRRRACVDPPPKKLTSFKICEQTKADPYDEDDKVICKDDAASNTAVLKEYDEHTTHFNAWKVFKYQRDAIDDVAECNLHRRIIFSFEKGSDHFDIDAFHLKEGHCINKDGNQLEHDTYEVTDYVEMN